MFVRFHVEFGERGACAVHEAESLSGYKQFLRLVKNGAFEKKP
jgi:hypothetical protein